MQSHFYICSMNKDRIFLVGFMASGKSRIGKLLANKLQYTFLDADDYIEKKAKQTIPQIFESRGEAYFRELEKECLEELTKKEKTVIATGGGMACHFNNMERMNETGTSVFLQVPPYIIVSRLLQAKNTRPLVAEFEEDKDALLEFVEAKLEERLPFYQKAHISVDCKSLTPTKVVKELMDLLS